MVTLRHTPIHSLSPVASSGASGHGSSSSSSSASKPAETAWVTPGVTLAGASIGPSITNVQPTAASPKQGVVGWVERHFPAPLRDLLTTKAEQLTPRAMKHDEPKLANLMA